MSKNDCCSQENVGTSVTVKVDVSKIVKYACIAGVFIVGIIFGTRCYQKMLEEGYIDKL
ncbi:hypothetical protein I5677_06645 [Mobilitalea sibirica]|uniref:Uncharacterized protein n=1 Tax=Mobilitalea sibirica TaxID=1462919 RepID=A0A8J7H688_9FIRM|nr:hypothetical protein [Mobilitalea sibirica]MBH1940561.1 hypothetical protein [Mobilitalea sibirica]